MKKVVLSVIAALVSVSSFASSDLRLEKSPVLVSYISFSKIDPALGNRYIENEGMISINEMTNEATLTLYSAIARCPMTNPKIRCIWNPIPKAVQITLPIIHVKYNSNFPGKRYVARLDARPVDGRYQMLRIVSDERGTRATYITQSHSRMTGEETKTESTFEGTELKRVEPMRALAN